MKFKNDLSYKEKYKDVEIRGASYLIEIFRYITPSGGENDVQFEGKSSILIHDIFGKLKSATDAMYTKFTHVAKVIKVGDDSLKYKEGEIVILNPMEVTGTVINPDYALLMQHSEANYEPILPPDGMPTRIGAIQYRYQEFFFLLPEEFEVEHHQVVTFLIPDFKIKSVYNI